MTKLSEEHKRKIGEGVRLSRRRFLQGMAATTVGGQELLTSSPKAKTTTVSKLASVRNTIAGGVDSVELGFPKRITRRQFLTEAIVKPAIRKPLATIENLSNVGKTYSKAIRTFINPLSLAESNANVKLSLPGKFTKILSKIISKA